MAALLPFWSRKNPVFWPSSTSTMYFTPFSTISTFVSKGSPIQAVDTSCCRLIFGEADFLPGIVVDKFSDVLVVESLALGIDRWKKVIVEAVKKVLAQEGIVIRGVYERSDAKVRLQEGMERSKGFMENPPPQRSDGSRKCPPPACGTPRHP